MAHYTFNERLNVVTDLFVLKMKESDYNWVPQVNHTSIGHTGRNHVGIQHQATIMVLQIGFQG